ncbi:MAG: tetratricopeptide repeat protein [Rhodothalassiaceae bacterium]
MSRARGFAALALLPIIVAGGARCAEDCVEDAARRLADAAYAAQAAAQFEEAAALLSRAVDCARNEDLRARLARDLGYSLVRLGRQGAAVDAFAIAVQLQPDAQTWRALGYAARADGNLARSVEAFEAAHALDPDDPATLRELGYLYKRLGQRHRAARAFRAAIRAADTAGEVAPERRPLLRREVRALENRIDGGIAILWRRDGPPDAPLSVGDRVLSQSQGLADIEGRMPWPRSGAGRGLAVFGRFIWALDGDRPTPRDESLQAGIGLKLKPLAGETFVLGVERLIAVGAFARNDWLLRASWSRGDGFEAPVGRRRWLFWSLYGDLALIDPADPDLQVNAEARLGGGMMLGPVHLRPHLQLSTLLVDDAGGTTSLLEGGPALAIRLAFGGDRYRADPRALGLTLAYRARLAGNARNRNGFLLSLGIRF